MSKNASVVELIGDHLINSLAKNMSRGWALVIILGAFLASIFILFNTHLKFFLIYWIAVFVCIQLFNLKMSLNRKRDMKNSGIAEIDEMTGIGFEEYLSLLFKRKGYKVSTTSSHGDFGADLVLEKEGQRICVQAKRYRKQVGIKAVQEVIGSLAHYSADIGWVVTNSTYTRPAIQLAKANGIKLVGRNELIGLILESNKIEGLEVSDVKVQVNEASNQELMCELCGEKMVLRESKRGKFYGCSTFPGCRNTVSI
jgi:restriction system protein